MQTKTPMNDTELRAALEGGDTTPNPSFRVQVIQRTCDRARRRAAIERMATWIAATTALGLFAQTLTPEAAGAPSLEAAAMILSLLAATFLLTEFTTANATALARRLERFLS